MDKQKITITILFALCLSLTITGCGLQGFLGNKKKSSQSKPDQGNQPIIAISLSNADPNQALILKGIQDMAAKENIQLKILPQDNPPAQSNQSSGQSGSEALQGGKVLIYQGNGKDSILKTAKEQKMPIIALGQLPAGSSVTGVIASDQEKSGEMMAESLVAKVPEGNIVIMQGDISSGGADEMLAGNRAVLSKYPKLNITVIPTPPQTESVAIQGFRDYLQKNQNKVQGVIAHTEKLAAQVAEVLKAENLDKTVYLAGGQTNVKSLERMANNQQGSDIDTSPYLMGVNAYQWAAKAMKNEPFDVNDSLTGDQGEVPAKVLPVKAVTKENLALVQKSYLKTLSAIQEESKQEAAQKAAEQKGGTQAQSQNSQQGQSKDQQGQAQNKDSQGQGKDSPAGTTKVNERIKTETTREFVDAQGKVLSTEKSTNEQVKTLTPEMFSQQKKQEDASKKETESSGKPDEQKADQSSQK